MAENKTSVFGRLVSLVLMFASAFGWIVSLGMHATLLIFIVACVRREPPKPPQLISVKLVELPPAPPEPGPPVATPSPPRQDPPSVKTPDPPPPPVVKPDPPKPVVKPDPPKPVVKPVVKPDPPKPPKPKQPSLKERMEAAKKSQQKDVAARAQRAEADRRRREQIEAQRREAEQRRREDAMRQLRAATTRANTSHRGVNFTPPGSGTNLPTGVSAQQLNQYQRYMGLVEMRLSPLWEEFGPTGLSGAPSDVTVQLTVRPDGTVMAKILSGRSDNARMNEAAQRLLNALRKLPPFSEAGLSVSTSTIIIEFTLGYSRENRR